MTGTRRYQLKNRAEAQERTRRKITEVTLELHGEIGPARTTIAEIAARAGVSRPTVYNQFPDELSLFAACSAHFAALHPPPELSGLGLEQALGTQYAFYAENQRVLGNVYRDGETIPALGQVLHGVRERFALVVADLVRELGTRGNRRLRATAVVALALEFNTWRSLDRSGLAPAAAAALMAGLIRTI
ncbi:MAG: helix-turn-helix domain-containing protein [Gaiellaceae bacterium]